MVKKKRRSPKKDIKYHIRHKSRLLLLLITKILLVFLVSVFVFWIIYRVLENALGITFVFIFSFAIASVVYLFLITKILKMFEF